MSLDFGPGLLREIEPNPLPSESQRLVRTDEGWCRQTGGASLCPLCGEGGICEPRAGSPSSSSSPASRGPGVSVSGSSASRFTVPSGSTTLSNVAVLLPIDKARRGSDRAILEGAELYATDLSDATLVNVDFTKTRTITLIVKGTTLVGETGFEGKPGISNEHKELLAKERSKICRVRGVYQVRARSRKFWGSNERDLWNNLRNE